MTEGSERIPLDAQNNPAEALELFVRLFGRTDGKSSWSAARGTLFLGGTQSLPEMVCPFNSIRVHTFTRKDDGFVERLTAAIAPLSPDGREVLSTFTNTKTGVSSDVVIFPYQQKYFHCPHTGTHRVDLETDEVNMGSIWTNEHLIPFALEYSEAAGIGWTNYTNPHERFGRTWSDTYRFRFSISDLFSNDHPFVSSTYGYVGESPAPPWLGVSEGYAAWQAWGRKYERSEDIPTDIVESIGKSVPDLLKTQH